MKKLIPILLLSSLGLSAKQNEINTNSYGSKFAQGALTGTALFAVSNSLNKGENRFISHLISIGGSVLLNSLIEKETNFKSISSVGTGAISVNLTFEIFKKKRRKCYH